MAEKKKQINQNTQEDWRERRERQMKEITERLEQGVKDMFTSEAYTKYLQTMSKFHNYSFNNTLLIAMQKPEATLVAGYDAWQKKFKRQVKRGEKGIQIIAPVLIRRSEVVEKRDPVTDEVLLRSDGQPETEEVEYVIPRFRVTTVFDVSQTYGEPLPQLAAPELMGNVENYEAFMEAIQEVSPVPIRFDEIKGETKGFYNNVNKDITIRMGMSERQTMKTAVHEVAHAKLHDWDIMEELGDKKDKMTKEVEAESVAYTVCQYFGLDTSDYSFPYIAGWSSGKDMRELRQSMDTIRKTAGEFIDSMTEAMQSILEERQYVLKDEDIMLLISRSEEEQMYVVVRNMDREELHVQLRSYHELYGVAHDKELVDFLKEQGANVIPWYDSNGLQVENPVEFYDVRYKYDSGVIDALDIHAAGQVIMKIERAEYREKLLTDLQKIFLIQYADKVGDMGKVDKLIGDMRDAQKQDSLDAIDELMHKVQAEMEEIDGNKGTEQGDTGRQVSEDNYFSGEDDRYAIYQIADGTKGQEYQFMGMEFVRTHGMAVDAADYRFVYGGSLSEGDTLESLYERFNINHPADFTGHSLSVSDVVLIKKSGEQSAYYVDSVGFAELPDFIRERMALLGIEKAADQNRNKVDGHEGSWHEVEKREIRGESFYLLEHDTYGKDVAGVIVNDAGELVAEDLWNGFDDGAMEAIQEYFTGKEIAREPDSQGEREEKTYPPVYQESLTYAMKHAAVDEYLDSRKLNIDCRRAVETAIRDNFDGMHLAGNAVDGVLREYGQERLSFVLACTVQHNLRDGRFSPDTKAWAKGISVPENIERGMDMNLDYVVESHPAVLDGFIGIMREKFKELEKDPEHTEPFIKQYYVVNDAYGVKAEREYQYFSDLTSALKEYMRLPNHLDKQIGMESTEIPPSQMPLITCKNGIEDLENIELVSLSGKWVNPETDAALEAARGYLEGHDTEIAYKMGDIFFYIQTVEDGYDYTFYESDFREIDGGLLANTEIDMQDAIDEIMKMCMDGGTHPPLKVISCEDFMEKVYETQNADMDRLQKLASDIDSFSSGHDPYEYIDRVADRGEQIQRLCSDIISGNIKDLETWLREIVHETEIPEEVSQAKDLIRRLLIETDSPRFVVVENRDLDKNVYMVYDRVETDYYQDEEDFVPLFDTEKEAQDKADTLNDISQGEKDFAEHKEPRISFYVAECMEFPTLGEYHNNLTLQEAMEIYRQIPSQRMNGVKGIGFCLEDGSMYDGEFELMSAGVIDKETINCIPHYKESPLVQKAISDLESLMEKSIPKTTRDTAENVGGRKQSVLQALRERQAKLKEQERGGSGIQAQMRGEPAL